MRPSLTRIEYDSLFNPRPTRDGRATRRDRARGAGGSGDARPAPRPSPASEFRFRNRTIDYTLHVTTTRHSTVVLVDGSAGDTASRVRLSRSRAHVSSRRPIDGRPARPRGESHIQGSSQAGVRVACGGAPRPVAPPSHQSTDTDQVGPIVTACLSCPRAPPGPTSSRPYLLACSTVDNQYVSARDHPCAQPGVLRRRRRL